MRLLAISIGRPQEWVRDLARTKDSALSRKRLNGQHKLNLDTGQVFIVGSKDSEKPVKEKQASLLQRAKDKVKLEQWEKDAKDKG